MTLSDAAPDDPVLPARLDEVSETLERLVDLLEDSDGLAAALGRLAQTALWAIHDADAVSVTVLGEDGPQTVACTSPDVLPIDRGQYASGEGPCLEAARTRQLVRVTVEDVVERWPAFAAAAETARVRAYLSAPLVFPAANDRAEEVVGSLNVYGYTPEAFTTVDAALGRLLTATAVAAIGNGRRYLQSLRLSEQLQQALASRAEIDQAKGALMAIHGIDADEAFARLVAQSQERNIKVIGIAREFLRTLRLP